MALNFLFYILSISIQPTEIGNISGEIKTHLMQPASNINISLYRSSDSSLILTAFTDLKGKYVFQNIPNGTYYISVYAVGYESYKTSFMHAKNENIEMPLIFLKVSSQF
jgi:5-hydroxyisourate hydrolase-like protein (transthyretin family)